MRPRSVLVIGAGPMGQRRARVAQAHPQCTVTGVCDLDTERARSAAPSPSSEVHTDFVEALDALRPDIAVVSTPNDVLMPACLAALEHGCDVLVEKPFGRNADEARRMAAAAIDAKRTVKVGFQLRHHPAIATAHEIARSGAIGALQLVRCVYGHGGRPGYASEWRTDPVRAGGGELIDQGVHVVDLMCSLLGSPSRVHAEIATLAWGVDVEDNAFATIAWQSGARGAFHVSWSQWQNRFVWQIYGSEGALEIEGLDGSYGPARLRHYSRQESGAPVSHEVATAGEDAWTAEWGAFIAALDAGVPPPADARSGVAVMEIIDALYRAGREHRAVTLG